MERQAVWKTHEPFMIPIMEELDRLIDSRLKISYNGMLLVDDRESGSPAPALIVSFDNGDFVAFIVNETKGRGRFAFDQDRTTKVSVEDPQLIEKLVALMPYHREPTMPYHDEL
jgi:hypothetical protein